MGVRAGPEVGVRYLGSADAVDVPETEPFGFFVEQDASGVGVEMLQALAWSVDAENTDDRVGVHGATIGWTGHQAAEAKDP
jgi:hypothetical protein